MKKEDDPHTPEGLNKGLAAGDAQPNADVDQITTPCPDQNNWVEVGAIDESTGRPVPGLPYKIFDAGTKAELAAGVLDENGEGARHAIPVPNTQLFAVFGTDEAVDDAMKRMDALQKQRALAANAVSEWRGMPAGLDEQAFNAAYDRIAIEAGRYEKPSAGFFEAASYGANMLWDYVSSGFDSRHMLHELYRDDRRRNFEDYQLATNARQASAGESFAEGGGQGLSFGFSEEAMSGLASLSSERSYEELVAERRQLQRARRLANPDWYAGGEIAGAIPSVFIPVGGAAAAGARGATSAGRAVVQGAKSAVPAGAALGALSGAGHDEGGVTDRLDCAATGAAAGGVGAAVLGGAGVLVARGVAKTRIWGRFSEVLKKELIQRRLNSVYKIAPATKKEIDDIAREIAGKYNGSVAEAPLKKPERALEKIMNDYGGDVSRISDIARNTIIVEKKHFNGVIKHLSERGANVKIVAPEANPFGYSGINSKLTTSNGIIGEIQVNTPDMIFAKEPSNLSRNILGDNLYDTMVRKYGNIGGKGHDLYEQARSLPKNLDKRLEIEKASREYYNGFR